MVKDEVVVGILTVDYLHSKTVVGESDDVNHRKEDKKSARWRWRGAASEGRAWLVYRVGGGGEAAAAASSKMLGRFTDSLPASVAAQAKAHFLHGHRRPCKGF